MDAKFREFLCILKSSNMFVKWKLITQNPKWLTSCRVKNKLKNVCKCNMFIDNIKGNFIPTVACVFWGAMQHAGHARDQSLQSYAIFANSEACVNFPGFSSIPSPSKMQLHSRKNKNNHYKNNRFLALSVPGTVWPWYFLAWNLNMFVNDLFFQD